MEIEYNFSTGLYELLSDGEFLHAERSWRKLNEWRERHCENTMLDS